MKSNITTQRVPYLQPVCMFVNVQFDSHILVISATTTNPVEGGDPTGGNGSAPNPFTSGAANSKQQPSWLTQGE